MSRDKITVYSDFHTPATIDGQKINLRPSMLDYDMSEADLKVMIGDGTESKKLPEEYSREEVINELEDTMHDFSKGDQIDYWIPGDHDMTGEFNSDVEGVYKDLIDGVDSLENLEGQNVELEDIVVVGGYNHERPEFPRYFDDVEVPSTCDFDINKYLRSNDDYNTEKLVNRIIKDISSRYNMPAGNIIEYEDSPATDEEKEFIESISEYADKKLSLIDRLEEVKDSGKSAVIVSHSVPNGKRRDSDIDKISAPVPSLNGKHHGSVVIEEVAPKYEDTIQAIVGGHIHEGSSVHEDGSVDHLESIPVINSGNGGMVELKFNDGVLEEVMHDELGRTNRSLELHDDDDTFQIDPY